LPLTVQITWFVDAKVGVTPEFCVVASVKVDKYGALAGAPVNVTVGATFVTFLTAITAPASLLGPTRLRRRTQVTTPAPATAASGDAFTVAATGGASGNPVTFTVGAGSACTLAGATYTMSSNTGHCYVVANQAGNSNYAAAAQVTETETSVARDGRRERQGSERSEEERSETA
jgi:hypothetical protein